MQRKRREIISLCFACVKRLTSHVTRHTPHVTRHKSDVTRHVSHPQKCRRRSRRAYVAPAPRIKRMHMKGESNASLRLHLCAVDIHCCGHLHVRQERIRGSVHVATSWLQYVFVFCVWRCSCFVCGGGGGACSSRCWVHACVKRTFYVRRRPDVQCHDASLC